MEKKNDVAEALPWLHAGILLCVEQIQTRTGKPANLENLLHEMKAEGYASIYGANARISNLEPDLEILEQRAFLCYIDDKIYVTPQARCCTEYLRDIGKDKLLESVNKIEAQQMKQHYEEHHLSKKPVEKETGPQ